MRHHLFLLLLVLAGTVRAQDRDRRPGTDTCRYELRIPPDLDLPTTPHHDEQVLRSPGCGTHLVRFPAWGTITDYHVMNPSGSAEVGSEIQHIHIVHGAGGDAWVDVTHWPSGDLPVRLLACGNGGSFTLELR